MPVASDGSGPRPSLSLAEARALALRAQGIGHAWSGEPLEVLERLGAIQLDSVNVLARSHQIVPFSRLGPHEADAMHEAVYRQRRGFEYWGHEASWLPMAEYRWFLPRMERMRQESRGWWTRVRAEHAGLYGPVLDRVRAEGPLGAADFEDPRKNRGTWWDWKPAKLVLEDLFDQGVLMATRRTPGFARVYDLTERVLPSWVETSDTGPLGAARHLLRRGVAALGVCTAAEAADYYRLKPEDWRPALAQLLEAGEVVEADVEGWRSPGLLVPGALSETVGAPVHGPVLLSPFDNLVWERQRVERLFGFRYRIEIYVPQPKRAYGYYVLPLLVRGALGGRADLKLDRKAAVLCVRGLWLEGAEPEEAAAALRDLALHVGATSVQLEHTIPKRAHRRLARLLA